MSQPRLSSHDAGSTAPHAKAFAASIRQRPTAEHEFPAWLRREMEEVLQCVPTSSCECTVQGVPETREADGSHLRGSHHSP